MSADSGLRRIEAGSLEEWRDWLVRHHETAPGAWLIYQKSAQGKVALPYDGSVREALCFGWIDNLMRGIDEASYMRRFVPRRRDSNWSASNRRRIRELEREGRMMPAGIELVDAAKASGHWKDHQRPAISHEMPDELSRGLALDPAIEQFFLNLTEKQQLQFIVWINAASRPATRARRVSESLQLLSQRRPLGMV